jgi:hypothetical protein
MSGPTAGHIRPGKSDEEKTGIIIDFDEEGTWRVSKCSMPHAG